MTGSYTCSTAIFGFHVVVVEPLPLVQFHTYDTQQVVAEYLAVLALLNERLVAIGLDLGQQLGLAHCNLSVVLGFVGRVIRYRGIVGVDLI